MSNKWMFQFFLSLIFFWAVAYASPVSSSWCYSKQARRWADLYQECYREEEGLEQGVKGHRRAWLDPSQEIQVREVIKVNTNNNKFWFWAYRILFPTPNDIWLSRNVPQPRLLATMHEVPGNVHGAVKCNNLKFYIKKHLHISLWLTMCAVK